METQPLAKPVPLIYEGDSYLLYVTELSDRQVHLSRIEMFPSNLNVAPTQEKFFDLTPPCRREVIAQINRRFPGRTVRT